MLKQIAFVIISCFILAISSTCFASINKVQDAAGAVITSGSDNLAVAFGSNVTANNFLVVTVHTGAASISSISDNHSDTFLTALSLSSSGMAIYYVKQAVGGATTVTVTVPSSGIFLSVSEAEFSGMGSTPSLDTAVASAFSSSQTTIKTGTLSTSGGNPELVVGAGITDSAQTPSSLTDYGSGGGTPNAFTNQGQVTGSATPVLEGSTTAKNTATINVPSSVQNGDLLVLFDSDYTTGVTCTGWVLAETTGVVPGGSGDENGYVFLRVASSEPSSYTCSGTTSDDFLAMRDYRNANQSTTPDAVATTNGNSATPSTSALSGLSTSSDLLIGMYVWGGAASGTLTFTENGSLDDSANNNNYVAGSIGGGYIGDLALSSNSASAQSGTTSASSLWGSMTMALEGNGSGAAETIVGAWQSVATTGPFGFQWSVSSSNTTGAVAAFLTSSLPPFILQTVGPNGAGSGGICEFPANSVNNVNNYIVYSGDFCTSTVTNASASCSPGAVPTGGGTNVCPVACNNLGGGGCTWTE